MNILSTVSKRQNKITYLSQSKRLPLKKRIVLMLIILIFLYFIIMFARQYWQLYKMRQSLAAVNEQIEEVKKQNEEMRAEVERLHSPDYLEQLAREELGMAHSGEILFYFQGRDNLPAND